MDEAFSWSHTWDFNSWFFATKQPHKTISVWLKVFAVTKNTEVNLFKIALKQCCCQELLRTKVSEIVTTRDIFFNSFLCVFVCVYQCGWVGVCVNTCCHFQLLSYTWKENVPLLLAKKDRLLYLCCVTCTSVLSVVRLQEIPSRSSYKNLSVNRAKLLVVFRHF